MQATRCGDLSVVEGGASMMHPGKYYSFLGVFAAQKLFKIVSHLTYLIRPATLCLTARTSCSVGMYWAPASGLSCL